MRFSAAVLVGGRSRRMGRDKAGLPTPPFPSLLARQSWVLGAIAPREILVGARAAQRLPLIASGVPVRVVRDDGRSGPLGGIRAVLDSARCPRVLILGVDLGAVQPLLLRHIVGAAPAEERIGVVPRTAGQPQPLVTLWPRSLLPAIEEQLGQRDDLSLQALVRRGIAAGCLRWLDVPAWDEWQFANWNQPTDLRSGQQPAGSGTASRLIAVEFAR